MKRLKSKPVAPIGPDGYPVEEVGYARVSTDEQDVGMQIAALKRRGIPDNNIYVDHASGKSMKRPRLQAALKLMEGRPGWTLVVWKLDRLGRDAHGLLDLQKDFDRQGWNLVSMTESIDTKTPWGRMIFGVIALMAQLERELIAERTKAGMARRKELGVALGRPTQITLKQFKEIERRLLKTPEPIVDIAKRIMVPGKRGKLKAISAPSINAWFPGWRSKTPAQRAAFRKTRPLPEN